MTSIAARPDDRGGGLTMWKLRIEEAGLVFSLAVAVVAFGGTEPLWFAAVQLLLLALGCLALLFRSSPGTAPLPVMAPAILLGWVTLQLIPLPRGTLRVLRDGPASAHAGAAPLSLAPHNTGAELLHWAAYTAAFYLALDVGRRRQAQRRLALALVALGSGEALLGAIGFLAGWQPLRRFLAVSGASPTGTYVNRDHFAGMLEMAFPFALALAFACGESVFRQARRGPRAWRGLLLRPGLERFLFWLLLSALLLVGIVCSLSRMGTLSALLSIGVVTFLLATSRGQWSAASAALAGFLCAAAGLGLWVGVQPAIERYTEPMTGRLGIWGDTLGVIRQSPVLGAGLGTLGVAITPVQTVYLDKTIDHAHNDYLEFAAELGLPGALFLFAAFFRVLQKTVRGVYGPGDGAARALAAGAAGSLAAILTHSLADFNLHIPANALLFAAVLGLAAGVTREQAKELPAHHELARA